jgi:uroporphyrinogen decarboxylase
MTEAMQADKLFPAHPEPRFDDLVQILEGRQLPSRARPVELLIDDEIMQAVTERYLKRAWVSRGSQPRWLPLPKERQEAYFRQVVDVYYRLGYDYVPVSRIWRNHPPLRRRRVTDTAELSRGEREWVDEHRGLITSWAEFEAFPWEKIQPDHTPYEIMARHLPEGMKITVMATTFQHVVDSLLGYETFFFMMHDDADLVALIFERWGQKVYEYYEQVIDAHEVGAIFHADDMGFRTSTMISPADLRRLLLPWLKKYAELAHAHGKPFWLHCCGNVYRSGVIDELIDDVRIDAFHSFQDLILPVTEFVERYGSRVAALGGVDMDKLVRMDETSLRTYIREMLDRCMPAGRFMPGSGNTIANYVPLANYAVLLEECRNWQPG